MPSAVQKEDGCVYVRVVHMRRRLVGGDGVWVYKSCKKGGGTLVLSVLVYSAVRIQLGDGQNGFC
jgi:hypothetical protein